MDCRCCCKRIPQKALNTHYLGIVGVYECPHCGAVQGECYRGDSYRIVKPQWAPADTPIENSRYFDLTVLGSDGITRQHGWFDVTTRLITQVG